MNYSGRVYSAKCPSIFADVLPRVRLWDNFFVFYLFVRKYILLSVIYDVASPQKWIL